MVDDNLFEEYWNSEILQNVVDQPTAAFWRDPSVTTIPSR